MRSPILSSCTEYSKMGDLEQATKSLSHGSSPFIERYGKFLFLVGGIMFFFGCHNYMQELIMNLPGFKV